MAWTLVAALEVQMALWEVLQDKLKVHFSPKPSIIASCHAFHHRKQAEGEPIDTYVVALHKTTLHCEFRDLSVGLPHLWGEGC